MNATPDDSRGEKELERSERRATVSSSAILGFVLIAVGAFALLSCEPFLTGTFGDSFGVLTSLFTGTALAGLWYTIRLQKIELKATRNELKGQKVHMAQQAYALSKQNFENTFFRIVGLIDERAEQMLDPGLPAQDRRGRHAFERHVTNVNNVGYLGAALDAPRTAITAAYRLWFGANSQALSAYFHLVFEALSTIDQSRMLTPQRYANILRALLSPAEKHLLFYHGLSGLTDSRLWKLLVKYEIYEGFDFTQIAVIPEYRRSWLDEPVDEG